MLKRILALCLAALLQVGAAFAEDTTLGRTIADFTAEAQDGAAFFLGAALKEKPYALLVFIPAEAPGAPSLTAYWDTLARDRAEDMTVAVLKGGAETAGLFPETADGLLILMLNAKGRVIFARRGPLTPEELRGGGEIELSVLVLGPEGETVPGQTVLFCTEESCRPVRADEEGVCRFAGPADAYHLQVLKAPEGYQTAEEPVLPPLSGWAAMILERE